MIRLSNETQIENWVYSNESLSQCNGDKHSYYVVLTSIRNQVLPKAKVSATSRNEIEYYKCYIKRLNLSNSDKGSLGNQ